MMYVSVGIGLEHGQRLTNGNDSNYKLPNMQARSFKQGPGGIIPENSKKDTYL